MEYIALLFILSICFTGVLCAEYELKVTTGSSHGAGTDANVYIKIIGTKGVTAEHKLVGSGNPFERGSTDHFSLKNVAYVGKITAIALKRDKAGRYSNWQLARVRIKGTNSRKWSVFKYDDWTKPNEWFTIQAPPSDCGISPMPRIIGGDDASSTSWPWQIGLYHDGTFFCGGSLIAPDWIVTAAHCVMRSRSGSYYTVRLGDYNQLKDEGTEEEIPGKRVIQHPGFNSPPKDNDIALIQLERPAKLSARVGTVCLPSQDEVVPTSARCYITGWGKIKYPGSAHHILQQAKLPPVADDVCAKKLAASQDTVVSSVKITPQMICAGKKRSKLTGCHGDSGGPYVCQASNGRWVLQGAVSWGSKTCSADDLYTVFARVAKFRNWINQYVSV